MDAREEDGVARAEDVVGAVAVVDVPVEDEDALGAERVSACRAATATLLKRQNPDVAAVRAW
jgi:hypothetical protein